MNRFLLGVLVGVVLSYLVVRFAYYNSGYPFF